MRVTKVMNCLKRYQMICAIRRRRKYVKYVKRLREQLIAEDIGRVVYQSLEQVEVVILPLPLTTEQLNDTTQRSYHGGARCFVREGCRGSFQISNDLGTASDPSRMSWKI